jgi:hypothetical protein
VAVYCGEVAFNGKTKAKVDGVGKSIADGFESKIDMGLCHSLNIPKVGSLEYFKMSLDWMQRTYVRYYDGSALPYGPDAFKHMTKPFFSIFRSELFDGDEMPEPEAFNDQPQILWSLFFRAFIFTCLWEGFSAYLSERLEHYQKLLAKRGGAKINADLIRTRKPEEALFESALKSGLLLLQCQEFEDAGDHGLFQQNDKELGVLLTKCKQTDSRINNEDAFVGLGRVMLNLWNKVLIFAEQAKTETDVVSENVHEKLKALLEILKKRPENQEEINVSMKAVWEAYILFNLPGLDLPTHNKTYREFVVHAKNKLVEFTSEDEVVLQKKGTQSNRAEKLKELPDDNTYVYAGIAAIAIGGLAFYFWNKGGKNQ